MNRCYQKILIVVFLSTLLFIHGVEETTALSIYGPIKIVNAPSYKLRGTTYIPLISACESHGLIWEWDPIGKVVLLKKNNMEARIKVDSYRVYVNGKIKNLEKPPLFYKGTVVVPISFTERTIDKLFKEWTGVGIEASPELKRKYTIGTIVIDPGHGGKDPGAVGKYGLKEKNIVLDISKLLAKELKDSNIKVVLTRDRDKFIPLSKRAAVANNVDADFFVSIHANAFRSRRIKGFEVYRLSEATDDSARALAVAENASLKYEEESFARHTRQLDATVWSLELDENRRESKGLADSICKAVSKKLAVRNRGVKSANFYVLRGARMPAVLVEVGFISNAKEASSLNSSYYRKKLAQSLAQGILDYKREYERTDGFTR